MGEKPRGKYLIGMKISSPAFVPNQFVPIEYTCDGQNESPPLAWTGVPAGTQSLALFVEDPDAPGGTFVHWVLYNIPPGVASLERNQPRRAKLRQGILQGMNHFDQIGYSGPCPPAGIHQYHFRLYALDTQLSLEEGAVKEQVMDAMKGHMLEDAELVARYQRMSTKPENKREFKLDEAMKQSFPASDAPPWTP